MPLKEKNLESSTRDPQGSCTPKSLWVSESSCIFCSASEEKPWAHAAGLPVEEMWSWCLDWVPKQSAGSPVHLTIGHMELLPALGVCSSPMQPPRTQSSRWWCEMARGLEGGRVTPCYESLSSQVCWWSSNAGGTPGFAIALHTYHRHLGHTASHVGWRVGKWPRMCLFVTARQAESGHDP